MGKSRHRKKHKQKVAVHKAQIQQRRQYVKKLSDDLDLAFLRAQMDQPAALLQIMEDQPEMRITGQ
jgi:hypothetical protein